MKYAALLALLLTQSAHANGLDDLKAALAPLQGAGALRGTFDVRETRTDLDAKPPKPESASISAWIDDDANGMAIRWDRGLLKRMTEEAFAPKEKRKGMGAVSMLGQTSAERVAHTVNYAPKMLQYLNHATLRGERMDAYNGKPARLIEVAVNMPGPDSDKVKMKDNTQVAQIWLGADNLPLAATLNRVVKGSALMFLTFESSSKDEMTFGVASNRLIVLKSENAGKSKGPGDDSEYRRITTFTPKA